MSSSGSGIHIPAGEGRATQIPAGGRFKITDLRGRQCCDLFAFNAHDVTEYASAALCARMSETVPPPEFSVEGETG